jgi:hypothetical protein
MDSTYSWRVGNEDTPWDSLQQLRDEHYRERVGEVEREDEDVQEHQAGESGVTVSDAAGQRASDEDTDEGTELARH